MRWPHKAEKMPLIGELRHVYKFLIFPKCLDGQWRWLEKARIVQEWQRTMPGWMEGPPVYEWVDIHWVDYDTRVLFPTDSILPSPPV